MKKRTQKPSPTARTPLENDKLEFVLKGQRLVLLAAILTVITPFVSDYLPMFGRLTGGFFWLGALIVALVGLDRVSRGMETSQGIKAAIIISQFIPFANLISLLIVNFKAAQVLREAGYQVGIWGAHK